MATSSASLGKAGGKESSVPPYLPRFGGADLHVAMHTVYPGSPTPTTTTSTGGTAGTTSTAPTTETGCTTLCHGNASQPGTGSQT